VPGSGAQTTAIDGGGGRRVIFKRRDARSWLEVIGQFLYPRGGWRRASHYVMHRLRRLPDPPHRIARGVAAGVFVCFTPMFGFHFLTAAALAFVMQGNIVAALLATFVGNPLTLPIIAAFCLELGWWILGTSVQVPLHQVFTEFGNAAIELKRNFEAIFTDDVTQWSQLRGFARRVFLPYIVGGIVPGAVAGSVAYFLTVPAVGAYQKRRVKKLKERFMKRQRMLKRAETANAREPASLARGASKERRPAGSDS